MSRPVSKLRRLQILAIVHPITLALPTLGSMCGISLDTTVNMNRRNTRLAELIATGLSTPIVAVVGSSSCSGGCIHRAEIVQLSDTRRYFVKSSPNAGEMLRLEAEGLNALAATATIRIPKVIAVGEINAQEHCLILEVIESQQKPATDEPLRLLGRQLALLHRNARSASYGWHEHNFLGSNRQSNTTSSSWTKFFAEQRLLPQLQMARNRGVGTRELFRLADRLIGRLDQLIPENDEHASLLHGDLWNGNFLIDDDGQPVIFDPAVYYGHREAELAMPLLFGGFPAEFFEAYQEVWPLAEGWPERVELYKLYHLLNHLNLFGSGYLESCVEIVRRFS